MMQEVEQKLYAQLKGKANCHFYWDYDQYYVNDHRDIRSLDRKDRNIKNEAGHYISQYLGIYGNKLGDHPQHDAIYNNMNREKSNTFIAMSITGSWRRSISKKTDNG